MFSSLRFAVFLGSCFLCVSGCAKKHSRNEGERIEMKIPVGVEPSQGGEGGSFQTTGGTAGEIIDLGGSSGQEEQSGGASGFMNDEVGGFLAAGGDGGEIPEGGTGGEGASGGVGGAVNPVGGDGGEMINGGTGGAPIPEPEPRELRFAPTPWPMTPELGLQTITDFERCGNIPYVDLQPMFEPIIDDRMDPDGEADHWVYKGPAGFIDRVDFTNRGTFRCARFNPSFRNDMFFSWTAPRAGKYTFQVSHQVVSFNIPEVAIFFDCNDILREEACSDPDNFTTRTPEIPSNFYRNVWVDLEENQQIFVLVEIEDTSVDPDRFFENPLLIQVFRQHEDEPSEPVLEKLSAKRSEDSNQIDFQFVGYDADADVLAIEVQLLSGVNGEVIGPFIQEREIDAEDAYWFSTQSPSDELWGRSVLISNSWGLREFNASVDFVPPAFLNRVYTHARIRLIDQLGNRSNFLEVPIEPLADQDDQNILCLNDWDCPEPGMCRFVSDDENEERQCIFDKPPSQVSVVEARKNDDGVYLSLEATSQSHDFAMFEVEFLDENDEVAFTKRYAPRYDSNRYFIRYFNAELQTDFSRTLFIPFSEIGTRQVLTARVRGLDSWVNRLDLDLRETELVDVELVDIERLELGDECEPLSITGACSFGSICVEINNAFTCQAVEPPSISNVSGYFYSDSITALIHFDTENDVLGYRVRGVENVSSEQVFFIDYISKDQVPYRGHIRHTFEDDALQIELLEEIEFQVIARNGYASEWQQIELQSVAGNPVDSSSPCVEVICDDGFECQEVDGQEMGECVAEPLPPEPDVDLCEDVVCDEDFFCTERRNPQRAVCISSQRPTAQVSEGASFYNPQSNMFVMEGTLELPDFELTRRDPYPVDRFEGSLVFYNEQSVIIGRISYIPSVPGFPNVKASLEVEMMDERHYAFRFERYLSVEKEIYGKSIDQVTHVQWVHIGRKDFAEPPFLTPLNMAPQRSNGELCDPEEIDDYCEADTDCVAAGDEFRCAPIVDREITCDPNTLNADLNWFEVQDENVPGGVRWETPGLIQLTGYNQPDTGNCFIPTEPFILPPVHTYRFEAPAEGDYVFTQIVPGNPFSFDDSGDGARMWIRSHCAYPDTELGCQEAGHRILINHPETGESRYPFQAATSIVHLEEEERAYVFVSRRTVADGGNLDSEYSLWVSPFESPQVVDPEITTNTVARLNPSSGQVLFEIELESFGTLPHLANVHLEYQPLDENGDVIPFERIDGADPLEPQKLKRASNERELLFQSDVGRIPLANDQLELITHFRFWLVADSARGEPFVLEAELPGDLFEIEGYDADFCDPSGIQNTCLDGSVCTNQNRGELSCHTDFFRVGFSLERFCVEPTAVCPAHVCQEDFDVREMEQDPIQPDPQMPTRWSFSRSLQGDNANDYHLNGGCLRDDVRWNTSYRLDLESEIAHTYSFEAPEAGAYRFYFSPDTTLRKGGFDEDERYYSDSLVLSVRDDCMFSATELGCGGGSLNGEDYDITLDLTQNQTVYIHVSHYNVELIEPWPYTLQIERVK